MWKCHGADPPRCSVVSRSSVSLTEQHVMVAHTTESFHTKINSPLNSCRATISHPCMNHSLFYHQLLRKCVNTILSFTVTAENQLLFLPQWLHTCHCLLATDGGGGGGYTVASTTWNHCNDNTWRRHRVCFSDSWQSFSWGLRVFFLSMQQLYNL